MEMNKELRQCPFCDGGRVKLRVYTMFEDFEGNNVETIPTPQIECSCGINFSLNDPNWGDLEEYKRETIKAWNRRADNER